MRGDRRGHERHLERRLLRRQQGRAHRSGQKQAVRVLEVAGETAQLRAVGGSVWVATSANPDGGPISTLLRLGPDNRATARYALPSGFVAGGIAIAFGSFWLADLAHPRVIPVRLG